MARACRVELVGEQSAAWRKALERMALADDACTSLRLELAAGEAHLLFITRDGREAQRTLAEPSELAPAIDALLVTGGLASATDDSNVPAASADPKPVAEQQRQSGDASRGRTRDLAALVALLAGARAGGLDAEISPLLNAEAHLRVERWEVGVQLGWEIKYYDFGGPVYGDSLGLVPALSFARRQPLRRSTLLAGGRVGMRAVLPGHVANSFSVPGARSDGGFGISFAPHPNYEGWTGLLCGVVFPPRSIVRLRAELTADLIFVEQYGDYAPRLTPDWAVSLAIGAEYGRP